MKKTEILFQMLASALWRRPLDSFELPSGAYKGLMELADKQTVTGLLCQSLMSNNVRLQKLEAVKTFAALRDIQGMNERLNAELVSLCRLLTERNIRFIVVKGATLGALYPEASSRMPGDIDFYCDPDNFEKAKAAISEAWKVEYEADEAGEQHLSFMHNSILFELHYLLLEFASPRLQTVFNRMIADSKECHRKVDGVHVPILSPEAELIYTYLHLYHHFIELGVGLRQICDLAVLLSRQYDSGEVRRLLDELDITRGFSAFEAICVDRLGLDESLVPVPISQKDRKRTEGILSLVFEGGNFGQYAQKYAVRSGVSYYLDSFIKKVRNYYQFYSLSPSMVRGLLLRSIPKKIGQALKRS